MYFHTVIITTGSYRGFRHPFLLRNPRRPAIGRIGDQRFIHNCGFERMQMYSKKKSRCQEIRTFQRIGNEF